MNQSHILSKLNVEQQLSGPITAGGSGSQQSGPEPVERFCKGALLSVATQNDNDKLPSELTVATEGDLGDFKMHRKIL